MEQICDDLFERTIGPVKNCLKDAGVAAGKNRRIGRRWHDPGLRAVPTASKSS